MWLRLTLLAVAYALLAAHFLRYGQLTIFVVAAAIPLLLLVRRRRMLYLVEGLTYLGALVWVHTAVVLVRQRQAQGTPWVRMALILAGVAALTFISGYLLRADSVRQRFPQYRPTGRGDG
jgi:hypothetical protein